MTRFGAISTQVADAMPAGAKASIQRFVATMPRIPALRQRIDSGQATRLEVYDGFSQVADAMIVAADAIGRDSADKDIAQRRSVASDLMRASDWLDRSNALAAAAVENGGLSPTSSTGSPRSPAPTAPTSARSARACQASSNASWTGSRHPRTGHCWLRSRTRSSGRASAPARRARRR